MLSRRPITDARCAAFSHHVARNFLFHASGKNTFAVLERLDRGFDHPIALRTGELRYRERPGVPALAFDDAGPSRQAGDRQRVVDSDRPAFLTNVARGQPVFRMAVEPGV